MNPKRITHFSASMLMLSISMGLMASGCAKQHRTDAMSENGQSLVAAENAVDQLEITRSGSQQSVAGPSDYFTGSARIDPIISTPEPSRVSAASVTFDPGARTAWHTHPLGQTLFVTSGHGWVQQEGGPIQDIHAGDVVWIPPGQRHWHGATPTSAMTHIAIQEKVNGSPVQWMEHVTDEQYKR